MMNSSKKLMVLILLLSGLLTGLFGGGCVSSGGNLDNPTPEEPTDADLPAVSPSFVYSTGWSQIIIRANYAKTTIDTGAHFSTNRNACGKDAYGVIPLEDWNEFATLMNAAVTGGERSEDFCIDPPETYEKYMDGQVEVKTGNSINTLYEVKGWQICTRIKDTQVAENLYKSINKMIVLADKEDCPNGWGSGS